MVTWNDLKYPDMWYLVCGFSKFALHLEFDLIVNTLHCFYQVLILQGLILLNTLHPHKSYFTGNVFLFSRIGRQIRIAMRLT